MLSIKIIKIKSGFPFKNNELEHNYYLSNYSQIAIIYTLFTSTLFTIRLNFNVNEIKRKKNIFIYFIKLKKN